MHRRVSCFLEVKIEYPQADDRRDFRKEPRSYFGNKRTEWMKTLPEDFKVKDFSQGDRADYLYFTGCTASFDPRIQEVAKALVFGLQRAEVDFGILGNEEQCCGNDSRGRG